jgi:hypothetical protein
MVVGNQLTANEWRKKSEYVLRRNGKEETGFSPNSTRKGDGAGGVVGAAGRGDADGTCCDGSCGGVATKYVADNTTPQN